VVVEGPLAGGHLGFKYKDMVNGSFPSLEESLAEVLALVKELETENGVSIPVIAGGGVRNHADVERLMQMGARGVQIGTRFITTEECDASMAYKQAYLNSKAEDVRIIESPVGLAARAIQNPFLQKAEEMGRIPVEHCYNCMGHCKPAETKYCISQSLIDSVEAEKVWCSVVLMPMNCRK
ncbi:MAG: nitronate monooxygenase, partial [Anaerotignum sp.]|nr:nitronate monooxygenase [Anaerotignum sp.]